MNPSETDQSSASSAKPKFGAKFRRKGEPVITTSHEIPGEETDIPTATMQKTTTPSSLTGSTSPLSTEASSKFPLVKESISRPKSPTSKEESYKFLTVTESSSVSTGRGQKSSLSETRRPVFVTASQQQILSDVMTEGNILHDPHVRTNISHEPHERIIISREPRERVSLQHEPRENMNTSQQVHEQALTPHHPRGTILEQAAAVAGGLIKQAAIGLNHLAFPKEETDPQAIPRIPPVDTTSPLDKFIIQAGASIADGLVSAGELMLGAANAAFPRPQIQKPPRIKFQETVTTSAPHKADDTVFREFTLLPRAPGAQKSENEEERIRREEIKNIFPEKDPVQIYAPPEDMQHRSKPYKTSIMLPLPPGSGVDLIKYADMSETLTETEERMRYLRGLARANQSFYATQPRTVNIPIDAKPSNVASNAEITSRYLEALEMTCKKANEQTAMLIDGNMLQEMAPTTAANRAVYKHKKCVGKHICVMETIQSTDSSGSEQEPSSARMKADFFGSSTGNSSNASYVTSRESKDFLTEFSSNINSSSKISTRPSTFSDYPCAKKRTKGRKEIVCSSTSSSESIEKPSAYTIKKSNLQVVKLRSSEDDVDNEIDSYFKPETDETTVANIDDFASVANRKSINTKSKLDSASIRDCVTDDEMLISRKPSTPRHKTRLVSESPTQTSYISTSPKQRTKQVGETRTQTSAGRVNEQTKPFLTERNAAPTVSARISPRQKTKAALATSTETLSTGISFQRQVTEHPIPYVIQNSQSRPKTKLVGQTATQTSFITAVTDQPYNSSTTTSLLAPQMPIQDTMWAYSESKASRKCEEYQEEGGKISSHSHKERQSNKRSDRAGEVSNVSTVSDIQYLPSLTMHYSESQTHKESTSTIKKHHKENVQLETEKESKNGSKGGRSASPKKGPQLNIENLCAEVSPRISNAVFKDNVLQFNTKTTSAVNLSKGKNARQIQTESTLDFDANPSTSEQIRPTTKEKKSGHIQTVDTGEQIKHATKEKMPGQMQTDSTFDFDSKSSTLEQSKHVGKMKGGSLASGMDKATLITTTKPAGNKGFRNFAVQKKTRKYDYGTNTCNAIEMSPKHDRGNYKRLSKRVRRTSDVYDSETIQEKREAKISPIPANHDIFEYEEEEALKKIHLNWMLTSLLNSVKSIPTKDKKVGVYERAQQPKVSECESLKEAKLNRKLTKIMPLTARSGNMKAFHSHRSSKFPVSLASRTALPFGAEFTNKRNSKQTCKVHKSHIQDEKAYKPKQLWKSAAFSSPKKHWSSGQSYGYRPTTSSSVAAQYKTGISQVEKPIVSNMRRRNHLATETNSDASEMTSPKYSPKSCRRLGITLYLAPPLESGPAEVNSGKLNEEKTTVLKFYLGEKAGHLTGMNYNINETYNTASCSNKYAAQHMDTTRRIVFEVDSKKTTDKLTIIMQSENTKTRSEASPDIRAELIEDGKRKKLDEYFNRNVTPLQDLNQNIIQGISIHEHPTATLHEINPKPTAECSKECRTHALPSSPVENLHSEMVKVTKMSQALTLTQVSDAENTGLVSETVFMQPNTTAGTFVLVMDKQTAENDETPHVWKPIKPMPLCKDESPIFSSTTNEQMIISEVQVPGVSSDKYMTQASVVQKTVSKINESKTDSNLQKEVENEKCSRHNEVLPDLNSSFKTQEKVDNEIGSKIQDAQTVNQFIATDSTSVNVTSTTDGTQKCCVPATNVSSTVINSKNVDESFKNSLQQSCAKICSAEVCNSSLPKPYVQDSSTNSQQQFSFSNSFPLAEDKNNEGSIQAILARIPQLVFSEANTLFQAESFYQHKDSNNSGSQNASRNVSEINRSRAVDDCASHSATHSLNENAKNPNSANEILQKNVQCRPWHSNLMTDEAHLVLSIPSIISKSQTHVLSNQTTYCSKENKLLTCNTLNGNCDSCSKVVIDNDKNSPKGCCMQSECGEHFPDTNNRTLVLGMSGRAFANWNKRNDQNILNSEDSSQVIDSENSFSCSAECEKQLLQSDSNAEHSLTSLLLKPKQLQTNDIMEETSLAQNSSAADASDTAEVFSEIVRPGPQFFNCQNFSVRLVNTSENTFSNSETEIPISITTLKPESNETTATVSELPVSLHKISANNSVKPYTRSAVSNADDIKAKIPNDFTGGAEDYRALVASLPRLAKPYKKILTKLKVDLGDPHTSENKDKALTLIRHPTPQLASILEAKDLEHEGLDEEKCARITFMPLLPPDAIVHQLRSNLVGSEGELSAAGISPSANTTILQEPTVPMILPLNATSNNNSVDLLQQENSRTQHFLPQFRQFKQPVSTTENEHVKTDKSSKRFHESESSQTVRRQLEQQAATLLQLFSQVGNELPQNEKQ